MKLSALFVLLTAILFPGLVLAKEAGSMVILTAQIISIKDNVATISRGSGYGFTMGMKGNIMAADKPHFGERADKCNVFPELVKPIGKAKLIEVDKDKSVWNIISESPDRLPRAGDLLVVTYSAQGTVENGGIKMVLKESNASKPEDFKPKFIGTIIFKDEKTFINLPDKYLEKKMVSAFSAPYVTMYGGMEASGVLGDGFKTLFPNTPEFFDAMQYERTRFLNIDARIDKQKEH